MPTQFEPRNHTTMTRLTTEMGEGAKSGFFGGVRAGVLGTLLGAALVGGLVGLGAYGLAAGGTGLGTWLTGLVPSIASYLPASGAAGVAAPIIGIGTGIVSGLASLVTPIPYAFGSVLAAVGGILGFSSGADRGVQRVAGEQAAALRDREAAAQTAMVRDVAQMRMLQAKARLEGAQGFIEQQVAVQTAVATQPEATAMATGCDKPKNPLIQAEGTKIDAATVAKMGLASMPVQEMAKA